MNRSEGTPRLRWPMRATALLLLPWVVWTVQETVDPLHGPSREDLGLLGNVREVIVEEASVFESASELIEGRRVATERITFESDGLVSQWVEYDRSAEPRSTRQYSHVDGLLTLEEEYRSARRPFEVTSYQHDLAAGRTTAEVRTGGGTLRRTIVYEYVGEGRLEAITEYDPSGTETSQVLYTYTGTEERADRYDLDGEIASWSIKTSDASGRLAEVALFTSGSEDTPHTISYEYDSHGSVVVEQSSGPVTIGFIVITSTPSEKKSSYEYTYDDVGNWTKRVTSVWMSNDDNPQWQATTVTYRSLLYNP